MTDDERAAIEARLAVIETEHAPCFDVKYAPCMVCDALDSLRALLTDNARLRERVASLGRDLDAIAIAGDERIRQRGDRIAELTRERDEARLKIREMQDARRLHDSVDAERRERAMQLQDQRDAAIADATRLRAALEPFIDDTIWLESNDCAHCDTFHGSNKYHYKTCPVTKARAALAGSDDA